jgi:hypothetical protein
MRVPNVFQQNCALLLADLERAEKSSIKRVLAAYKSVEVDAIMSFSHFTAPEAHRWHIRISTTDAESVAVVVIKAWLVCGGGGRREKECKHNHQCKSQSCTPEMCIVYDV